MKAIHCIVLGAVLCLSGCALSPRYSRPAAPVPPAWRAGETGDRQPAAGAPAAPDLKWRDFFADEKLRQVIDLALQNNRDLRLAALNVEKAQALYRIQRSQQYPTVGASASGQIYRVPDKVSPTGRAYTYEQYRLDVAASSWELDFFGRVRSLKSQALEQYLATEQARSAAQISLVGEVASTYLALGADRDGLRLAQSTLDSQQASLDLIQRSRDAGIASDLELRQSQSQVEAARVDIARYTGSLALDRNALELLVGAEVPAALLPGELGSDQALKDVSPGVPSDVLLRRPDILTAEHQLKAAYANIGAARAAFFPQITLTGGGGALSSGLSDLFKLGARSFSFSPQAWLPIFDAGARRANLKVAETDRDAAIASYERALQSAFREVSDSLSQRTWLLEQEKAQQSLVETLAETYRLADARYKAGVDSYLSVLVAQRSLNAGQQALVSLKAARLVNLVTLYKALGGGA